MTQRKYFGTDGIRGLVGQWPISADFMLKLGRAVGSVLAREGTKRPNVLIGKDTRISGYMFEAALEAGLVAAGADVDLLGPMPTPAVAYLTRSMRAQTGIVISASHNPHHDNGIKFFSADGEKLSDEVELAIEREVDAAFVTVPSEQLGKARRLDDAAARYAEYCKSTVAEDFSLHGLRLVLDCAHGATYQVAPKVFAELGAEVVAIGDKPDGFNINREVGSTHPQALQQAVLTHGADLGIAFDGDGDRVQLVDRLGVLADGDDILYLLARSWQAQGKLHGPVVGTLMSNYGLQLALAGLDVPLIRANVGDRYVLQQLKQHGGVLGGETSGHILCLDRATTGDGIIAALAVLEALVRSGEDLAAARQGLRKMPQVMLNVRAVGAREALASDQVRQALAEVEQVLHGRGRVVLRASGTEPLVRVTIEGADAAEVQQLAEKLAGTVKSAAERS
ncbi:MULTISPECIES: phosphoglucosamine mutase [Rhodanobacter]|uniref:phosphoglucosamine mutase n=1 Tax=Rhodanobacter TaxID=75309 RepID=UPI00041D51D4|nr:MULTISPECIES: phosphoglucosamine mutase [Rhodanobacter]KZC21346.1 phosphoglucosamine mutase [Rhodanobacter denitrificans]UJJ49440.1 phosphoglucosamine mutase [Rhodanobacter denitrificans]UJM92154.1 phosphoglucosamine mutase [Rhodanobacter denitrificans]UJM95683.1 phosphoglucosamine mutase [Rhodanobacter denitrificans]UJN21486.1 phosphoglucosamine mutase [Rhodanobacter denitrificans]